MYYNNITKEITEYPYRFKTEKEFNNIFGSFNSNAMSYLYGQDLKCSKNKSELYDKLFMRDGWVHIPRQDVRNNWDINKNMIVKNGDIIVDYNTPKKLVYEEYSSKYFNTISNEPTKFPYRFKTKEEFEEEFGEWWYDNILGGWSLEEDSPDDNMDYLFGKNLEYSDDKKEILNYLTHDTKRVYIKRQNDIDDTWSISKQMLIDNDINKPNYNVPKQLVYESKILKFNKYKKGE